MWMLTSKNIHRGRNFHESVTMLDTDLMVSPCTQGTAISELHYLNKRFHRTHTTMDMPIMN
jgi:hypothetical protein